MKRVPHFTSKLVRQDETSMVYQKDDQNPQIVLYQANVARAHIGRGFQKSHENDTDLLPDTIQVGSSKRRPIVCAPEALSGSYLAGFIEPERDVLFLCEQPVDDASKAARCAHRMAHDESIDGYDLVFGAD
jgi:hypothetical protein